MAIKSEYLAYSVLCPKRQGFLNLSNETKISDYKSSIFHNSERKVKKNVCTVQLDVLYAKPVEPSRFRVKFIYGLHSL